jgi:hypothetical protein
MIRCETCSDKFEPAFLSYTFCEVHTVLRKQLYPRISRTAHAKAIFDTLMSHTP